MQDKVKEPNAGDLQEAHLDAGVRLMKVGLVEEEEEEENLGLFAAVAYMHMLCSCTAFELLLLLGAAWLSHIIFCSVLFSFF